MKLAEMVEDLHSADEGVPHRFRYEPAVWGMVFPLGMYTTSSLQLDRAMGYGFLDPLPETLVFIALAAWALAVIGLIRRLARMAVTT